MSLLKQIDTDYITAYKAKEEVRVAVLRMLKTALKNLSVELGREPNDDEVFDAINKQVKQRRDSFDQYTKAGRDDLAQVEAKELVELEQYLPAQLSDDELDAAIAAIIEESGASGMGDMGKVMKDLTASYKGRFDGKKASTFVRNRLSA